MSNNTQQQEHNKSDRSSIRVGDSSVNFQKVGTRNQFGSRREFVTQLLLSNWNKDNLELSKMLGCTLESVSRLRKSCKGREAFLELAFEDYMRYRLSDEVRPEVKFQQAGKIIALLLGSEKLSEGSRSVLIRIIDDVKAKAPDCTRKV